MASSRADLKYPIRGISETYGFSYAEELTSRDERNMRSVDPTNGRIRGAQRAGLGVYCGANKLNGDDNKVQAMAAISLAKSQLDWSPASATDASSVNNVNSIQLPADQSWAIDNGPIDIAVDDYGILYLLHQRGYVYKYNSDLGLIDTIDINHQIGSLAATPCCVTVDKYQNVFVGTGNPFVGGTDKTNGRVFAYVYQEDDTYAHAWTIDPEFYVNDLAVYKDDLMLAVSDKTAGNNGGTATSVGLRIYTDYDATGGSAPTIDTAFNWDSGTTGDITEIARVQRLAVTDEGVCYMCYSGLKSVSASAPDPATIEQLTGRIVRLDPYTSPTGTIDSWTLANDGDAVDPSGIGFACAIGPNGEGGSAKGQTTIYTTGHYLNSTAKCNVRRIIDLGPSSTPTWGVGTGSTEYWCEDFGTSARGWSIGSSTGHIYCQRIAIDSEGTAYIPYGIRDDSSSDFNGKSVIAISKLGLTSVSNSGLGGIKDATCLPTADASGTLAWDEGGLRFCAIVGDRPTYGTINDSESLQITNEVYLGGLQTAGTGVAPSYPDGVSVWKTSIALPAQTLQSPRTVTVLGAANGTFKTIGSTGFTDVTNGTYDSSAVYVQMVPAFGKIYITDGTGYYVYDPDPEVNSVSTWVSTDQGTIPPRCRLLETWRGRMVLGRDPEDPTAWHMSAVYDPDSWDNFPQNPSARDAISARNSRSGGVPDIINALVPYNDDVLIVGGDHSIWTLTGDPRAGGQLDLVTDQTGIAFGRPWCRDPEGRVWFLGSEGGLYQMSPQSGITNVSSGRVMRALQNIDLGSNYVNLVWNYLDEGVHVFVMPFGASNSELLDHWFYDAKTGSFHKDRYGSVVGDRVQPTAAVTVNGDLFNDRVIMLGGEDGRVRRWGRDASGDMPTSDEITASTAAAIDSYVTVGPIIPVSAWNATQLTEFTAVLGDSESGANYEFFSSESSERLGPAKQSGSLQPGRNKAKLVRVSGDNLFMRLRNASAGQTWAYESGGINVSSAGAKR